MVLFTLTHHVSYFTDVKTEAQSSKLICPRSLCGKWGVGFSLRTTPGQLSGEVGLSPDFATNLIATLDKLL